jgi:Zn-finger protein
VIFCRYLTQNRKVWSNAEGLVVHIKNDVSKVMMEIPGVMYS